MITPSRIRNILFASLWIAFCVWLYKVYTPEYIEINSCKYEKHTEPSGESWLVLADSCGCVGRMDERQFEFED